jgi:hypothetical protein
MWFELYSTEAVIISDWTKPNYNLRYLMTRLAVHGFHHMFSLTKTAAVSYVTHVTQKAGDTTL